MAEREAFAKQMAEIAVGQSGTLKTGTALGGRFCLKAYVETSVHLLEGVDEMVKEGYFGSRTDAVNEAISILLKQYKTSKLHVKDAKRRDPPAGI